MRDELIINLAPTGMVPTRADTPHVPLTPDEVAADVRRCLDVGASIVHIHPRDESGEPTSPGSGQQHSSPPSERRGSEHRRVHHDERAAEARARCPGEAVLDLDGPVRPQRWPA